MHIHTPAEHRSEALDYSCRELLEILKSQKTAECRNLNRLGTAAIETLKTGFTSAGWVVAYDPTLANGTLTVSYPA